MEWNMGDFRIRPWRGNDAGSIVKHANNRNVWRNLRDRFPYPYTLEDAEQWIKLVTSEPFVRTNWVIEVNGEAAGGIGLTIGEDVHRKTAEIGYWLGEEYWNRGIVTRVVGVVTEHGFKDLGLQRIYTGIFEWNPASMRVLEKNGYVREGVERKGVLKDGCIIDAVVFSRIAMAERKT